MSNEKNKNSLQEAFIELDSILETATKKAKDKIANEMQDEFNNLLKEELNKNNKNKESVKESNKKDKIKEPIIEGKKKTDSNQESLNEMEEMDMREMSIDEIEEVYNEAHPDDEFEVELSIDDLASELGDDDGEMEDAPIEEVASDSSDPYGKMKQLYEMMSEMIKEMDDAKMHNELQEKFDNSMKEMYGEDYKESLGEEKCNELYEMYSSRQKNESSEKDLVEGVVDGELDAEGIKHLADKFKKAGKTSLAAEIMKELDNLYGGGMSKSSPVSESEDKKAKDIHKSDEMEEIKEEDGDGEDRKEDEEVDETASSSQMSSVVRTTGNENLPNRDQKAWNQRPHQKESVNKKVASLIEENKKTTKKLQEAAKANKKYQMVLEKYRNQLQEMAVVNTNIAHVNDILIQESDISSEKVQSIIDKFKNIDTITESEKAYKNVLSEMKEKKETLDESIKKKINDTVGESSSKLVEQVVEKTAFGSKHIDEIKRRMNYIVSNK